MHRYRIAVNEHVMEEYFERQRVRRFPRIDLDEECLRWTPLVSSAMLDEEERRAEIQVGASCL